MSLGFNLLYRYIKKRISTYIINWFKKLFPIKRYKIIPENCSFFY